MATLTPIQAQLELSFFPGINSNVNRNLKAFFIKINVTNKELLLFAEYSDHRNIDLVFNDVPNAYFCCGMDSMLSSNCIMYQDYNIGMSKGKLYSFSSKSRLKWEFEPQIHSYN